MAFKDRIPELSYRDAGVLNGLLDDLRGSALPLDVAGFDEANFQRATAEACAAVVNVRQQASEPDLSEWATPLEGGRLIVLYRNDAERRALLRLLGTAEDYPHVRVQFKP